MLGAAGLVSDDEAPELYAMTAAEEAQARLEQVALTSAVRVRKGQLPVGRGELAISRGILVLSVRGKERMRAPLASVQRVLAPMFAHEGIRTGRRWLPRLRYRVTFVDPVSGEKDKDAESRWGKFFNTFDSERRRATDLDRVMVTAQAAESGVLSDRVWHRTGLLAKEHGTLKLAQGGLDFMGSRGETLRLAMSEIRKISAPQWRSGRVTIKTGDQRHVFGFDPRRLDSETWEEGELRKQDGERATEMGFDDAGFDSTGGAEHYQTGTHDEYEFSNGIMLIGMFFVLAFEGNYWRRIRRRDWKRVLDGEGSADELLTARAKKSRARLEEHDRLMT